MNLLYCGDKNILDGLLISVLSILRTTGESLDITVLTMHWKNGEKEWQPIPDKAIESLDSLAKSYNPENRVRKMDISGLFLRDIPERNADTRFTPCCMLRLYADELELPDKLLYLDTDTIARSDIREFYDTELGDNEFAAILDHYGRWFFHCGKLKMNYVNSGVLLLNMKKIRETGLFAKARRMCREKKMFMPDQTALNRLAKGKLLMPRCYNEQRRLQEDTVIQHFTTSFRFLPIFHKVTVKPWEIDRVHDVLGLHEYDALFEEYERLRI